VGVGELTGISPPQLYIAGMMQIKIKNINFLKPTPLFLLIKFLLVL